MSPFALNEPHTEEYGNENGWIVNANLGLQKRNTRKKRYLTVIAGTMG